MDDLHGILQGHVDNGSIPGAVALVARGDWLAFGRMLLAGGIVADGRRVLTADSVRLMTSDHTTQPQREIGGLFLESQGWGFGGSVDFAAIDPWKRAGPLWLGRRIARS